MAMTSQPLQLYVPDDLNSIQGKAYRLITSGPADSFVMLLIAGNTILLMLQVKFLCVIHCYVLIFMVHSQRSCAVKTHVYTGQ